MKNKHEDLDKDLENASEEVRKRTQDPKTTIYAPKEWETFRRPRPKSKDKDE